MALIEIEHRDAVAIVTLNRPPVNAFNEDLGKAAASAFVDLANSDARAVVVWGGDRFSAGADISAFAQAHETGNVDVVPAVDALRTAADALEAMPQPSIAAIAGFAFGGGLELALAADFRYLAADARVGQPEIGIGLIPGAGGTQRLARLIGFQRAKDLVMTGRTAAAEEALAMNLVDKVLPPDELLEAAIAAGERFTTMSRTALAAAKVALADGWGRELREALLIEAEIFDPLIGSDDAREGVAAFLAKRDPSF